MKPPENISPYWTSREMEMIQTVEVFRLKPGIMKKAEKYLENLRASLSEELKIHPKPFPEGTDTTHGQIARGENHKGFPFLSLDLPQKFSKTEFFTFRVLFWWGHYLGFSLLLKGDRLPDYMNNLLDRRKGNLGKDIFVALNESPWEWERTPENFIKIQAPEDSFLVERVNSNQYLKLVQFHPIDEAAFSSLDWAQVGLQTYRAMTSLVLD
jgi:hypothetical protein